MKVFTYISMIIFPAIISCKKLYNESYVPAGTSALVVEGMITNDSDPPVVRISKAKIFSNAIDWNSGSEPVERATVYINDRTGKKEILKEYLAGTYTTDDPVLEIKTGTYYRVNIILPNGEFYKSDFCLMREMPVIDSVYAGFSEKNALIKNVDGSYSQKTQPGFSIYLDASPGKEFYYKTSLNIVEQNIHGVSKGISFAQVRCFSGIELTMPDIVGSSQSTVDVIKKHEMGFFPIPYHPNFNPDTITPTLNQGYRITCNVYSISKTTYSFFKNMIDQLNAPNSLFDPISTQLVGNIHCVSDSTKIALGYFEAASVAHKYIFFRPKTNNDGLIQISLPYLVPVENRCDTTLEPPEWVYK